LGLRGKQDFGWRSASSAAINPPLSAQAPQGTNTPHWGIPKLELDQEPHRFSLDPIFHFR
jgi:hypothetical protein